MANGEGGQVIYYITCGSLGYCAETSCLSRKGTAEEEATYLEMTAHKLLDRSRNRIELHDLANIFLFLIFKYLFIFNLALIC